MKKHHEFSYTINSQSSASKIFEIWEDVDNWKNWDTELIWSELRGKFEKGATGHLQAKKSPKAKFTLSEVTQNKSFTSVAQLPFGGEFVLVHGIEEGDGGVSFNHTIYFTGIAGYIIGSLLINKYKQELPKAMKNIEDLACANSR